MSDALGALREFLGEPETYFAILLLKALEAIEGNEEAEKSVERVVADTREMLFGKSRDELADALVNQSVILCVLTEAIRVSCPEMAEWAVAARGIPA